MKIVAYSALVLAVSLLALNVSVAQADCGKCKPAAAAGKCPALCSQPADKAACAASDKCPNKDGCCPKTEKAAEGCSKAAKEACHAATQPASTAEKSAGSCQKAAKAVAASDAAGSCGKTAKASVAAAE